MVKHVSQMTKSEINYLRKLRKNSSVDISKHAFHRSRQRGLSFKVIKKVVRRGEIVEYCKEGNDHRIVLRLRALDYTRKSRKGRVTELPQYIFVVYDVVTNVVVTAYKADIYKNYKNTYVDHLDIIKSIENALQKSS